MSDEPVPTAKYDIFNRIIPNEIFSKESLITMVNMSFLNEIRTFALR